MRIKIIKIVIWSLFVIIGLDLIYVQLIRGQYYYRLSTHNRIRVVPVEGSRGRILDRNGIELANNRVSFDVLITPQEIKDRDQLFSYLSHVLKVDPKDLLRKFYQKRYTPFAPVVVAEDITRDQAFALEENKFLYPSLLIQENYRRNYPFKNIGAHVLGYVAKINPSKINKLKNYGYTSQSVIGYSGVEEFYDEELKGQLGGVQIEVNSQGRQVRLMGLKDPLKGKDIQLTIDYRVQLFATEALGDKKGAIIAMDFETGEILGMVSSPSYDPNIFVDSRKKKQAAELFLDELYPVLNRGVQGQYPPGSTFKIPVAIGALESKMIDPEETFLCNGFYRMGRRRIRCAHTHGTQKLIEGIAHSCNVYFINTGLRIGPEMITKYARLYGLGQLTRIDLPYEKTGLIPSKKEMRQRYNRSWYKGDTANLSIGQGDVLVTPIQMMNLISVIARDGEFIRPRVLKSIDNKEMKKATPYKKIRIEETALSFVKEGLYNVVHDFSGTAHIVNIDGLSVSGKTGTAQSAPARRHHAWFVGYNTEGNRKIAFCVFLEYGGSSYYAVRVAKDFLMKMRKEKIL